MQPSGRSVSLEEDGRTKMRTELRVVGDLRILAPHDLASCCDETQVADLRVMSKDRRGKGSTHVDFYYRTACHNAQLCEHGRGRVLFHSDDIQLESRFEVGWWRGSETPQENRRTARWVTLAFL
jgi:hypothetical protein